MHFQEIASECATYKDWSCMQSVLYVLKTVCITWKDEDMFLEASKMLLSFLGHKNQFVRSFAFMYIQEITDYGKSAGIFIWTRWLSRLAAWASNQIMSCPGIIKTLPTLVGVSFEEFCGLHIRDLLPPLVISSNMDGIKELAMVMGIDTRSILVTYSGNILAYLLLYYEHGFKEACLLYQSLISAGPLDQMQLFRLSPLALVTDLVLKLGSSADDMQQVLST